ncbi:hypothetical protein MRX96_051787 [Rhipicephalus microplus]
MICWLRAVCILQCIRAPRSPLFDQTRGPATHSFLRCADEECAGWDGCCSVGPGSGVLFIPAAVDRRRGADRVARRSRPRRMGTSRTIRSAYVKAFVSRTLMKLAPNVAASILV